MMTSAPTCESCPQKHLRITLKVRSSSFDAASSDAVSTSSRV
jgi:hypothetical protein